MKLPESIFKAGKVTAGTLAIAGLIICLISLIMSDSLTLPWLVIPTYTKTPLFLEYFQAGGQSFGIETDQILVWQHFATGNHRYLSLPDYLLFTAFFITTCIISVVLTYLSRFWFLICTGLMLFILMQLNLGELGFLPAYIDYLSIFVFAGVSYFFHSVKPSATLGTRSLITLLIFGGLTLAAGQFSQVQFPISAGVSFGLFAPLLIVALTLLFIGGDTMHALFTVAAKNAPNGRNGLIHFMTIGLVYLTILILLFLEKTGDISLDLWLVGPHMLLIISLLCGYLALNDKLAIVEGELPVKLIKNWLYPVLSLLCLTAISYIKLSGNDSLDQSLQMAILATHLAGGAVFYLYAFMNFTPVLLANERVANFFKGERAPLLTGRILYLVFIAGVVFYLNYTPYYQARAGRYVALGALGERIGSDLLTSQYYKQAVFYDYYNFKANYALHRLERKTGNTAELIERLNSARTRDNSTKATIALSNHYSEKGQLFNKLISLRENSMSSEQLSNNLGIAHFEFQNYDSAAMALSRSKQIKESEAVDANHLALLYHLSPEQWQDDAATKDVRTQINALALRNKTALPSAFDLPLSPDSLLTQDNLFYLFNSSLDRSPDDRDQLLTALEYYLSNTKNNNLRDFLLLGHAIQAYEAGRVNEAFNDLNELKAHYNENTGFYSYILGLWAP